MEKCSGRSKGYLALSENTALPARERGLQGAEVNSAHSPSPSSRAQRTQLSKIPFCN
ncbi:hypothetical protein IQ238_24800 [Pleurocapsales cyanobacterium LEGE 06147]|nr:hypothetical protein [Pleurocapsales cyanobacterium LEGE 06147]